MMWCSPYLHLRLTQHCFFLPGPPNLLLSLQLTQMPQSSLSVQPWQSPHLHLPLFLVPAKWWKMKVYYILRLNPLSWLSIMYVPALTTGTVLAHLTSLVPLLSTFDTLIEVMVLAYYAHNMYVC